MRNKPIVHIVDDTASMRTTLDNLIHSAGHQTRLYSSTQDFIENRVNDIGCLLMDVRLPGMSCLEFQDQLAHYRIHLPVILMIGINDNPMPESDRKACNFDFLTKPFSNQEMFDAVSIALEKDIKNREQNAVIAAIKTKYNTLTVREQQVMLMVTVGKMNRQAVGELNLSEVIIKIHRGMVMRKMGSRTLAELERMAEAIGLHKLE